jgi:hypothetical protein
VLTGSSRRLKTWLVLAVKAFFRKMYVLGRERKRGAYRKIYMPVALRAIGIQSLIGVFGNSAAPLALNSFRTGSATVMPIACWSPFKFRTMSARLA